MTTLSQLPSNPYTHTYMYVCMSGAWCNSNPMTAFGAHPPEVPSVAWNTQADDTLPSIVGRGGANCRITPRPHTQLFRGPPPPPGEPPPQTPPPRGLWPTVSWGGIWRPKPRGRPPPHFLSVYFFSVSFCPCLPGPLGLDKLPPTPPPCPLTA